MYSCGKQKAIRKYAKILTVVSFFALLHKLCHCLFANVDLHCLHQPSEDVVAGRGWGWEDRWRHNLSPGISLPRQLSQGGGSEGDK